MWLRLIGGAVEAVCTDPVCEVNPSRHLDNEDSGWYFCRVPANYTSIDYYINVTVLGENSVWHSCMA